MVCWPSGPGRAVLVVPNMTASDALRLSPAQIAEAQKLAREWKPR